LKIPIYQVDAFANHIFKGNPAAVCPLNSWLPDETLQQIASENNLSETAFFVMEKAGYHIRWFTPKAEVDLCGHATLASAYVLFRFLNYEDSVIIFKSKSGPLSVCTDGELITLNFPETPIVPCAAPEEIVTAFGDALVEVWKTDDYMVVLNSEKKLVDLVPDSNLLAKLDCRGIAVTAKGVNVDFVSRFFAPRHGIDEDPVTGSSHCYLTPYWSNQLNKNQLTAKQLSKRSGDLKCERIIEHGVPRILISGKAALYLRGEINVSG